MFFQRQAVPEAMEDDVGAENITRESFPHLTDIEWEALHRLSQVSGEALVRLILTRGSESEHHLAAQEFIIKELADARVRMTSSSNHEQILKIDVSTYDGDSKGLSLNRWFCEIDLAITARKLRSDFEKTTFLLSRLGGKAKDWAFGRKLSDPTCFPNLSSLQEDLRLAFEPPQDETLQRANFFSLKQGRLSMREYVQKTRELVSNILKNPIDMTTQVHVFICGMNTGFQRFYLTRKPPASLEEAFAVALREDYNIHAANQLPHGMHLPKDPNAMEIDTIQSRPSYPKTAFRRPIRKTFNKQLICFRCQKPGHRASECRAPAPVAAASIAVQDSHFEQPKNGENQ